jgi:hypothetical protein
MGKVKSGLGRGGSVARAAALAVGRWGRSRAAWDEGVRLRVLPRFAVGRWGRSRAAWDEGVRLRVLPHSRLVEGEAGFARSSVSVKKSSWLHFLTGSSDLERVRRRIRGWCCWCYFSGGRMRHISHIRTECVRWSAKIVLTVLRLRIDATFVHEYRDLDPPSTGRDAANRPNWALLSPMLSLTWPPPTTGKPRQHASRALPLSQAAFDVRPPPRESRGSTRAGRCLCP